MLLHEELHLICSASRKQQDFNSSLLTAAFSMLPLGCATPTLQPKQHQPAEANEMLEVSRRTFSFLCIPSEWGWCVCVCKAQLGQTASTAGAVQTVPQSSFVVFPLKTSSKNVVHYFFPRKILYPCFEVSPCFFPRFLNRKGGETSFLCRSASFCNGKAQQGEGCGKILSATQLESGVRKKVQLKSSKHLKISQH